MSKIRVLVDVSSNESERAARSSVENLVHRALGQILHFNVDTLANEIISCIKEIQNLLSMIPKSDKGVSLQEVSFTIGIDSEGKACLFSALSAGTTLRSGFTFTMQFDSKSDEK